MAVIKTNSPKTKRQTSAALRALTSAALSLPGMVLPVSQASEADVSFQYSHYEENDRELFGVDSKFDPIEVDTIHGRSSFKFLDRFTFDLKYTEDTWSGATPIATAPLDLRGNRSSDPDGVSGATPFINGELFFDSDLNPLETDGFGNVSNITNKQLVHTMSSASPETRHQGDINLEYEWDEAAVNIGSGVSIENDYDSYYGSLGGRLDFNQKLTTLNFGFSYTASETEAIIDHDAAPYIDLTAFKNQISTPDPSSKIIHGDRDDLAFNVGLTQILNKDALVDVSFGYTHSTGYMENPYKVVEIAFIDPALQFLAPPGGFYGDVHAFLEQRPDTRNQWTGDLRFVQYINKLDAALHLNYRFYHDSWGINAHTFEGKWAQPLGKGWVFTPRVRYYSQDEAKFYQPYLISNQGYNNFNSKLLPNNFSSDHRLAGFGTLSGGFTISKELAKGISLQAGFEYYTHASNLQLGGGNENDFSDFESWVANGVLNIDISALSSNGGGHDMHDDHDQHYGGKAPSGVKLAHMMDKAGSLMFGYDFAYARMDGDFLHGAHSASDQSVVTNGCKGTSGCRFAPKYMEMKMHMLNIMYAPTDWLNLMLMPQFVSKEMDLRELDGRPDAPPDVHEHSGVGGHSTGGVGDTKLHALIRLLNYSEHHIHMGLGISAPTGDVDLEFRPVGQTEGGLVHFGMQLGSGTWDFLPSLTYTGMNDQWSWGAQLSAAIRLESHNESGYALGDVFQSTAWGSYAITDWLSVSTRGIYTVKGSIKGDFNKFNGQSGPMDFPSNQGGRFWDVGFGINAYVPVGGLKGNSLSFEWIQPVEDDVNGYQLEREGFLSASWSYSF